MLQERQFFSPRIGEFEHYEIDFGNFSPRKMSPLEGYEPPTHITVKPAGPLHEYRLKGHRPGWSVDITEVRRDTHILLSVHDGLMLGIREILSNFAGGHL